MSSSRRQLDTLGAEVIKNAPGGSDCDFGVLLNRFIKVAPPGTKIHRLRRVLNAVLFEKKTDARK